jgi:hypothetical protein
MRDAANLSNIRYTDTVSKIQQKKIEDQMPLINESRSEKENKGKNT